MNNNPIYLMKFVPEYEHAQTLVRGSLFMRPAIKYDGMDGKQGDTEGIIGTIAISEGQEIVLIKGYSYPIYCVYSIYEQDIFDGRIHVSKQAIADFKCLNGYGVLVPYEKFVQSIPSTFEGFHICYGNVRYREGIPNEIDISSLSSEAPDLFFKRNDYKHQQEFRVVYLKSMFENGYLNKERVLYLNLTSDLVGKAKVIPVADMDGCNNEMHVLAV